MANRIEKDDFLLYTGLGNQINGDNVVGMTSPSKITGVGGMGDRTNVLANLTTDSDRDGMKKYLGLLELYATTHNVQVPIQMNLVKNLNVLDVDPEGEITYDINIPKDSNLHAKVIAEVDNDDFHAGALIKLVLDRKYTAGDILSHNPSSPYSVKVSRENDVEPFGEGWLHYVIYESNDPKKQYPRNAFQPGTKWVRTAHPMGEYSTQWAGIASGMSKPGVLNMSVTLPSPQGIETAYTIRGGNIRTKGAEYLSRDTVSFLEDELAQLGGFDKAGAMFTGRMTKGRNGRSEVSASKVSSTLEYIAMKELVLMNAYSNTFSQATEEHTEDGVVRTNEGVWQQARRGKIVTYPRPGGATINTLQEAAQYLYKNSSIPVLERRLHVRGGFEFINNIGDITTSYATNQLSTLAPFTGSDSQISKVLTGSNDNLKMGRVNIAEAFIEGVGWVTREHDRSFDYKPVSVGAEDDFVAGGFNSTTYSGIIDVYDSRGKSTAKFGSGAKVVNGGNLKSNFFYLKPDDGTHFFYGHNLGRAPFQGVSTDLKASLRYMGHEFFASMRSWIMMVDTTAHVVIELQDTYLD